METKGTPKESFGKLPEGGTCPSAWRTKPDDDIVLLEEFENKHTSLWKRNVLTSTHPGQPKKKKVIPQQVKNDVEPQYTDVELNVIVSPYRCGECKQVFRRVFRVDDPRSDEDIPAKCRLCRHEFVESPFLIVHQHFIKSGGNFVHGSWKSYLRGIIMGRPLQSS